MAEVNAVSHTKMDILANLNSQIRIESIGDIQNLIERLSGCDVPKLSSEVLSMMVSFIVVQLTNSSGDTLAVGLVLIVSLTEQALLHPYSADDWHSMKLHLVELLHNILKLVTFNSCFRSLEDAPSVLQKIGDVFLPVCEVAEIKKEMVETCGCYFLKIVCWEEFPFTARLHVFTRFKKTLQESSHAVRRSLLSQMPSLIPQMIEMLKTCGDFGFQELLTESLIRFSMCSKDWKGTLVSWFKDPSLAEAAKLLEIRQYELSVRKFLNMVNQSLRDEHRVYSLASKEVRADSMVLQKPQGYDELWVDCSPRTGSISLMIDGGSGVWSKVIVDFSAIKSIRCFQRSFSSTRQVFCQLLVELSHPILMPLETETLVSKMVFVFQRENTFLKAEKNYFKFVYSHVYEPVCENSGAVSWKFHLSSRSSYSRTSSSAGVSSLLNATLSTIDKVPELRRTIASSLASKSPPPPTHVRQLTTSTPDKEKRPRKLKSCLRRGQNEKQLKEQPEHQDILDAASSRSHTSGPSIIVDRSSMKNILAGPSSNLDASQNSGLGNLFTSVSSEKSLLKFVNDEVRPRIQNSYAEVSFQPLSIATMSTNERSALILEEAEETSEVDAHPKESSTPGLKPAESRSRCIDGENGVLDTSSSLQPISHAHDASSSRHGLSDVDCNYLNALPIHGRDIAMSLDGGSVKIIDSPHEENESVFKNENRPSDFKDLLLPLPENTVTKTPVPLGVPRSKKKFFTFQKSNHESSGSEAPSHSSCSTLLSRKNVPRAVKLKNARLDCSQAQASPASQKSQPCRPTAGRDPYNFVDDGGSIGTYRNNTSKTPQPGLSKKLRKKKLFTPGKDDTFELSSEDTSQPPPSTKEFPKHGLNIFGPATPNSRYLNEEKPLRRSSRRRKEVNYAQFLNATGIDVVSPESNATPFGGSSVVEKLRSESAPMFAMRVSPPEVVADENEMKLDLPQHEKDSPILTTLPLSPPSTVPSMSGLVNPGDLTPGVNKKNRKRGKKNQCSGVESKKRRINCSSTGSKSTDKRQQPPFSISGTQHSGISYDNGSREDATLPVLSSLREEMAEEQNREGIPLEKCAADQSPMKEKIVNACDLIVNELKSFITKINRDGVTESLKMNVDTYLSSHNSVLKVLKEECHKIVSSAVVMQSACDKILGSADVTEDMVKAIETIHDEESRTVAVSIKSKDPRFFSKLRQSITTILQSIVGAAGRNEERINPICDKILKEVKLLINDLNDRDSDLKIVESLKEKLSKCLDTHRSAMKSIRKVSLELADSTMNIQDACDKYLTGAESFAQLDSNSLESWQSASLSYLRMYFAAMNTIKEDTAKIVEYSSIIQHSSELLPFANTFLHVFDGELRDPTLKEIGNQDPFIHLRDLIMECLQDLANISGEL